MRGVRLGLAVAALSLAGCGSGDEPAPDEPVETRPITEADFIGLTRDEVPSLAAGRDDAELVSLAADTCDVLQPDDTESWSLALAKLTRAGVDAREAGQFIGYAAATYCPTDVSAAP